MGDIREVTHLDLCHTELEAAEEGSKEGIYTITQIASKQAIRQQPDSEVERGRSDKGDWGSEVNLKEDHTVVVGREGDREKGSGKGNLGGGEDVINGSKE